MHYRHITLTDHGVLKSICIKSRVKQRHWDIMGLGQLSQRNAATKQTEDKLEGVGYPKEIRTNARDARAANSIKPRGWDTCLLLGRDFLLPFPLT